MNRLDFFFKLGADGKTPEACGLDEWTENFANIDSRRVALTKLDATLAISTIFLGLASRHNEHGQPYLFETVVYDENRVIWRGLETTWLDAQNMHLRCEQRARDFQREARLDNEQDEKGE